MHQSATAARADVAYVNWPDPHLPRPVRFRLEALEKARAECQRGFNALRRRGAEVGGLLIGTVDEAGVAVEEIEASACEYRFGPTFRLAAAELETLAASVGQRGAGIVGFWRSNTRPEGGLDEHDREFLSAMGDLGTLMLLFQPGEEGLRLRLFVREESGAWTGAGERPFVGAGRQALPQDRRTEVRAAPPVAAAAWKPERVSGRRRPLPWKLALTGALLVALTALAAWVGRNAARPGAPPASLLGFRVERVGGDLRLSWDRSAVPTSAHIRARLEIRDGGSRRTVDLDERQFRSGTVLYSPGGGDIHARLEVFDYDKLFLGEDVLVILPARESAPAEAPAAARLSSADRVAAEPSDLVAFRRPARSAGREEPAEEAGEEEAAAPAPRPFTPFRSAAAAPAPAQPVIPPPALHIKGAAQPPLPRTVVAAPAPPPRLSSAGAVPPKALQQVRPMIPDALKVWIRGTVAVRVAVRIDETGKVMEASTSPSANSFQRALHAHAEAAARQWRFAPATIGGKPVPSTTTIVFQFAN